MKVNNLYNVATNKDVLLTLRIRDEVRDQFKIAAEARGATMSALLHQYIFKVIREEKEANPQSFTKSPDNKREGSASRQLKEEIAADYGLHQAEVKPIGELAPKGKKKMPYIELKERKKKTA